MKGFDEFIAEHEASGARYCVSDLGFQDMPNGYALFLNPDESHYYFVRDDGYESAVHWDKWAIYRWARADVSQRYDAKQ